MPFIPHTDTDIAEMLESIGAGNIDELFDEIPAELKLRELHGVPTGVSEQGIARVMRRCARDVGEQLSFIGAGAYEHHIPAAVWEIATRGEYYTAYTPYQAEASQGTLQLVYEYQSMMTALTGMDVSNASMYDGASSLAEASLMAVRANRKSRSRRILMAGTVSPLYRRVARTLAGKQDITFEEILYNHEYGTTPHAVLDQYEGEDITAVVIQQPNFFGVLENVDELADWAHTQGALVIAVVNPTALAVLQPPGEWGETGADIACGEGQPLGIPLSSGGPFFGFLCCRKKLVRQMPGRLVGRTTDLDGKVGYVLTLQAREQHIRRSKATSNICTNQGLMVTAATIYMAMLGAEGLERVGVHCNANTRLLVSGLTSIDGVDPVFDSPFFHEAVVRLDRPVAGVLDELARQHIFGGLDLNEFYPELGNCVLVCATETKTASDIQLYVEAMREILADSKVA